MRRYLARELTGLRLTPRGEDVLGGLLLVAILAIDYGGAIAIGLLAR